MPCIVLFFRKARIIKQIEYTTIEIFCIIIVIIDSSVAKIGCPKNIKINCMVNKRKKLLKYLSNKNNQKYKEILKELNIRG